MNGQTVTWVWVDECERDAGGELNGYILNWKDQPRVVIGGGCGDCEKKVELCSYIEDFDLLLSPSSSLNLLPDYLPVRLFFGINTVLYLNPDAQAPKHYACLSFGDGDRSQNSFCLFFSQKNNSGCRRGKSGESARYINRERKRKE